MSWILQAVVLVTLSQRLHGPVLTLPAWSPADTRALALTLLLVPLLMGPPYRNLGRQDDTGAQQYRAYFTADFVWHTALAVELRRMDSPPRNPYMASRDMHYYWTYFLLPALAAGDDVQIVLKANAMLSAPLLIAMLYLLARTAVPRAGPAAAAVALGVLATSAEGSYELARMWESGARYSDLAETNIDAISSWRFQWLRIDGLAAGSGTTRSIRSHARSRSSPARLPPPPAPPPSRQAIWLAGGALGLATTFNPFVGGVFCIIYGIAVALDALPRPGALATVVRHTQAAVPVLIALAWCAINEVADNAGGRRAVGWLVGLAGNNTLTALLISTGPVLLPALAGLGPGARCLDSRCGSRRHRGRDFAAADAHDHAVGAVVGRIPHRPDSAVDDAGAPGAPAVGAGPARPRAGVSGGRDRADRRCPDDGDRPL